VDFARSCSIRPFYFFTGPNAPYTMVRWYFAPEGALPLPQGTIWGSSDWCDRYEKADTVIGEFPRYEKSQVQGPVPGVPSPVWSNGKTPSGVTGQAYCGTPADFQDSKPWNPAAPALRRNVEGIPECCFPTAYYCLDVSESSGQWYCLDTADWWCLDTNGSGSGSDSGSGGPGQWYCLDAADWWCLDTTGSGSGSDSGSGGPGQWYCLDAADWWCLDTNGSGSGSGSGSGGPGQWYCLDAADWWCLDTTGSGSGSGSGSGGWYCLDAIGGSGSDSGGSGSGSGAPPEGCPCEPLPLTLTLTGTSTTGFGPATCVLNFGSALPYSDYGWSGAIAWGDACDTVFDVILYCVGGDAILVIGDLGLPLTVNSCDPLNWTAADSNRLNFPCSLAGGVFTYTVTD
jgi:hypothetical protein